jgi:hypothetical protein
MANSLGSKIYFSLFYKRFLFSFSLSLTCPEIFLFLFFIAGSLG